jgi:hypothetical protein
LVFIKQELVSEQFGWQDVMKDNSSEAYLHCLTATSEQKDKT